MHPRPRTPCWGRGSDRRGPNPAPRAARLGSTGEQTHRVGRWEERSEEHASQGVWGARSDRQGFLGGTSEAPHCWAQSLGAALPRPFTPQAPPCLSALLGPSTLCSGSGYISGMGHPLCSPGSHSHPSGPPLPLSA